MEISESFQRRGHGSYLVQELKRLAYELGAVPCARCNTTNIASRRTLEKAGFVPFAHMLTGVIVPQYWLPDCVTIHDLRSRFLFKFKQYSKCPCRSRRP